MIEDNYWTQEVLSQREDIVNCLVTLFKTSTCGDVQTLTVTLAFILLRHNAAAQAIFKGRCSLHSFAENLLVFEKFQQFQGFTKLLFQLLYGSSNANESATMSPISYPHSPATLNSITSLPQGQVVKKPMQQSAFLAKEDASPETTVYKSCADEHAVDVDDFDRLLLAQCNSNKSKDIVSAADSISSERETLKCKSLRFSAFEKGTLCEGMQRFRDSTDMWGSIREFYPCLGHRSKASLKKRGLSKMTPQKKLKNDWPHTKKRQRLQYSDSEVIALHRGVQLHGHSWNDILGTGGFAKSRTAKDLKDKFRSIENTLSV